MRDELGRFKKGYIPYNKNPKAFHCLGCGKTFEDKPSANRKFCSQKCANRNKPPCPWKGKKLPKKWCKNLRLASIGRTGKKAGNWKGGVKKTTQGYILIHQPSHPRADCQGYVRRSYLVMEKILKRHLTPQEVVHHINNIKDDDSSENLQLFSNNSEHQKHHHKLKNHISE